MSLDVLHFHSHSRIYPGSNVSDVFFLQWYSFLPEMQNNCMSSYSEFLLIYKMLSCKINKNNSALDKTLLLSWKFQVTLFKIDIVRCLVRISQLNSEKASTMLFTLYTTEHKMYTTKYKSRTVQAILSYFQNKTR